MIIFLQTATLNDIQEINDSVNVIKFNLNIITILRDKIKSPITEEKLVKIVDFLETRIITISTEIEKISKANKRNEERYRGKHDDN